MLKNTICFILLQLLLIQHFANASTSEEKLKFWQGEWGEWKSWVYPDVEHSSGDTLKISECYIGRSEAKNYNCAVLMISRKDDLQCTAWSQIAIDSDDQLVFEHQDERRGADCRIELKRSAGIQPAIEVSYAGKCDNLCKKGEAEKRIQPIFAKSYRLKSSRPFFPVSAATELTDVYRAQCYGSQSKAVVEWCSNIQIGQLDSKDWTGFEGKYQDCFGTADYVNCKSDLEKRSKADYFAWRKSMWDKCDGASNVADCLTQHYNSKLNAAKKIEEDKMLKVFGAIGDEKNASHLADRIDGVYKMKGTRALVSGEKYKAEDILELVKTGQPKSLYFKTKLNFDNGHQCFLFGVAQYRKNGDFVYQQTGDLGTCVLQIKVEKDLIALNDLDGKCRENSCGARGGFDGVKFPLTKRRPIRYLELLQKSEDYKIAMEALNP